MMKAIVCTAFGKLCKDKRLSFSILFSFEWKIPTNDSEVVHIQPQTGVILPGENQVSLIVNECCGIFFV